MKAQAAGGIGVQHNPRTISVYITSNYGGIRNMGKVFGKSAYTQFLQEFQKYLQSID
jgi:hypothetical protein